MRYPALDLAPYTKTTLDIDETLINAALSHSHGQPTMSDEDVKLAILSLLNTCKRQQTVIDELVNCVNEMRAPKTKPWIRKK